MREAWSSSFRQEPPAAIVPSREPAPGTTLFGRALAAAGLRDPRILLIGALGLAGALAAFAHRANWPLALGASVLSPALASGLALGAPDALLLAGLLAAFAFAARGAGVLSGLVGGLASATQMHAMAPMLPAIRPHAREGRFVVLGFASWAAVVVLSLVAVQMAGWDWARRAADPPSLGLGGLLVYRGAEMSSSLRGWMFGLPVALVILLPPGRNRLWVAAIAMLAGLWLWGESASWLGAPIVLLALGALEEAGDPTG